MTSHRPLEERIDEAVIGLADDAERYEIERLAATDPEIARLVDRARARFAELDATAVPEALPDDLWSRVSQGLDTAEPESDPADSPVVVPFGGPKPKRALVLTTMGSLAASVLLAVALGWALLLQPEPAVITVLIDDAGVPVALVEGAEDNATTVTLLGPAEVPDGRIMQVWTKPSQDGPPVSLGILERPRSTHLSVDGLPAPSTDQLYEITFEQVGGSPTGLPTGPIYGKGLSQRPH